jgi:hypothetical protein
MTSIASKEFQFRESKLDVAITLYKIIGCHYMYQNLESQSSLIESLALFISCYFTGWLYMPLNLLYNAIF